MGEGGGANSDVLLASFSRGLQQKPQTEDPTDCKGGEGRHVPWRIFKAPQTHSPCLRFCLHHVENKMPFLPQAHCKSQHVRSDGHPSSNLLGQSAFTNLRTCKRSRTLTGEAFMGEAAVANIKHQIPRGAFCQGPTAGVFGLKCYFFWFLVQNQATGSPSKNDRTNCLCVSSLEACPWYVSRLSARSSHAD